MSEPAPPMMSSFAAPSRGAKFDIFVRKLFRHSRLSTADQQELLARPFQTRRFSPNATILREGGHAQVCPILLSGFANGYKIAADGGRQIVALARFAASSPLYLHRDHAS